MSEEETNKDMERLRKRLAESESSHWYDQEGKGCHEIEKKTKPGEFRSVNKTDAEKLDLVPSVTNLLSRYKNRSGIEKWARGMIYDMIAADQSRLELMAKALENNDEAKFNELCKQVDAEAENKAKEAANLGSVFHYFIEEAIKHWANPGKPPFAVPDDATEIIRKVEPKASIDSCTSFAWVFQSIVSPGRHKRIIPMAPEALQQEFSLSWNTVATTASRGESKDVPFGIGGKFDLLCAIQPDTPTYCNLIETIHSLGLAGSSSFASLSNDLTRLRKLGKPINLLIDWKTRKPITRKTTNKISFPSYPSDPAQLAAYAHGISRTGRKVHVACNVFIASDVISLTDGAFAPPRAAADSIEFRFYTPEELESGLRYMNAAAAMWIAEEEASAASAARKGRAKSVFVPAIIDE